VAGAVSAATVGPWLVLLLIAAGLLEVAVRAGTAGADGRTGAWPLPLAAAAPAVGGLGALAWVAFKVGALSYGGGFVIIPLMQSDAVHHYHWMTAAQFLNAVALGQITPGPVVQTVAVVGYAAAGVGGGLLAAVVAFTPSFLFVLLGGRHFDRLRANRHVQAFLTGAGPAVVGAIAGSAIPLALALTHGWQYAVLAAAALWLLALRRGVVSALLAAAGLGVIAALAGLPVS
jgi:chromate transporter